MSLFPEINPATITQKNGTKLSNKDIQDICNLIRSGVSYSDVQKKYHIGGGRLARILKICKVSSILRGGWEKIPVETKKDLYDNDDVLTSIIRGVEEMKHSSMKRKSGIK